MPRITPAAPPRSRWFLPVLSVEHVRPGPDGDVRLDLEQRFASRAVVQDIVSKMPSAASPSNPLADQQWVRDLASQAVKDKADKVSGATAGDFAGLDEHGNLADSGKKPADFATAAQGAKADTAVQSIAVGASTVEPGEGGVLALPVSSSTTSSSETTIATSKAVKTVDDKVVGIEGKIPSQASASNQLADKAFVNSSVATNTATFRGTFNLVTDLQLPLDATHNQVAQAIRVALVAAGVTPDDNDYVFVQIPQDLEHTDAMKQVDRYKCTVVGSSQTWAYEWTLNNSSFTAAQWAAISSGITSGAVAKLGALPTAAELAQALAGKMAASATGADIAVSGTDATKIDAALAGKATKADATLTERGFTEWDCNPSTVLVNGVNYPAVVYRLVIGRDVYWALGAGVGAPPFTAQPYDETATSLTFSLSDSFEPHTVVATREALSGYQLGSQSDKPLQPAGDYAPATNIAKTALGQDVQTSLGKADTAIQGVKVNGTEITPDAQKKVNLEVATKADATLTEKWTPTFALTDAQKEVFSQTPGASDNDYALTIVPSSSTESYLLYVGSYNAASFRKIQSDSTNLIFDGGDARLGLQPGDLVATLNGYTLGSQSDKPLASEAEAEALRTGKANRAPNPTAGNLAALDAQGNPTDSGVKASDKLDSASAAPAFSSDSSVTYPVGSHVTYNGKLYVCTTATTGGTWVAGSWTADTMTDPDAVLDITAQNQLRVVAKDGTILWAQGYDLASTSSATLACDAVNNFTFADGATTQAFTLPTAPIGKVGDFGLDIDNFANTSAATISFSNVANNTASVIIPKGENLNDMLSIAAGELARFYISLSTFRVNNLPTWHILKQVVENGGATV